MNVNPEELVSSIKAVYAGNLTVSSTIGYRLVKSASANVYRDRQRNVEYQGDLNFLLRHFETPRSRITRELHDMIGYYLTNVIVMAFQDYKVAKGWLGSPIVGWNTIFTMRNALVSDFSDTIDYYIY